MPVECLQTTDVHAARRYGCGSVQLHSPRRSGAEVSFRAASRRAPPPAAAARARFHRSYRCAARHRQRHLPWSGLGLLPTAAPIGIAPLIAHSGQAEAEAKATATHQGGKHTRQFLQIHPTWSRTFPSARTAKLSECLQSVVCGRCFRYAATFGWLRTASTDATRRSHLAALSAAATEALSSKYSSTNT